MSSIDYVQALGAGAGFDTKKIVEALVNAERAPTEARINSKIAESEAKISGLGKAVSILNVVKDAANRLNDAKDFNTFTLSNSQESAFSASSTTSARACRKVAYSLFPTFFSIENAWFFSFGPNSTRNCKFGDIPTAQIFGGNSGPGE